MGYTIPPDHHSSGGAPKADEHSERYPLCTNVLRQSGKPYPRTCQECGLGPCKRSVRPAAVPETTDFLEPCPLYVTVRMDELWAQLEAINDGDGDQESSAEAWDAAIDAAIDAARSRQGADSDRGYTGFSGKREHAATKDCWCEPELDYVAPDGTKVWKHRETQ